MRGRTHNNLVHCVWLKKRRIERKIFGVWLLGGKCEHCSETTIEKLQFHHIAKTTKTIRPCDFAQVSYDRFIDELNKCKLLCASCHTKHHNKEKGYGITIEEDPEWDEMWEELIGRT